ncbi:hypothetical protein CLAFUW4_13895 [Fulvia fulva]|uniref:Carboxylesterase type B domain-containing protein n=1 Tax=Passalora fulva TaxID=5499 RepID=A0A9Q8PLB3_PASFU|nr:uncharacterized protein CLAFUR5_13737 [Fulvia fulva]KAK4610092.1 hypothetical protein CLAFUR4_13898 [Fulvia fulva]KAK4611145.1 hypothetical protein CLAFUR0_13902 [Fulvia fulva]UJO24512.1 hypothetical protein CLAFUR5_13737 [Fulvia fulva]WPV22365.1 hypothetical protein CLAFUW4_13895 [Fulvia fulva]WPV36771.1 hypothetical protein CLAFUW7_13903 [Fulvia fulva]
MYALNALYANAETYPFTDEDYAIQEKMSSYWANFAKTLDPNLGGSYGGNETLAKWRPNEKNGTQVVMELGDAFESVPIAGPERVEFVRDYFERQAAY